jgi:8-oxo-dGTP pyrophosphatase MutT (NUDIX family)
MTSMRKKESSQYFCGNCGKKGHVYRKCLAPITSLGVIVYKMNDNNEREYLMIQRRDTLGFVEFMRGKYNLSNYSYIYELFSIMTENERGRLISKDFDELWSDLWMNKNTRQYHNEYENSRKKYNKLKEGFYGKKDNGDEEFVTLEKIHNTQPVKWQEPEWGFPKGRRMLKETDIECATREFREETGLEDTDYHICEDLGRIEETFYGTNNIRYRHIYFIGIWNDKSTKKLTVDSSNFSQISEIGNISWFPYTVAHNKIRCYNWEKRRLLYNLEYELNDIEDE